MSGASVLYDVPGPKAKARNLVYSVVGSLAVLGLIAFVVMRLNTEGQLAPEVWNIFNNAGVRTNIRDGVLTTLQVFAVAAVLSLLLGVLLAVARLSDHKPVRWLATGFIELFRAVPLLITIYALWVILLTNREAIGLTGDQPQFWALVIGLTVYNGSVQAEVLRAGINSVPTGQREAAYALGMSKTQVMTTVLIPQAVRAMLPTIISQLVVTLKDTSLGYIITFEELLFTARQMSTNIIVNGNDTYVPFIIVIGTIYVAMCLALSALANWIERRGRRAKTGIGVATAGEPVTAADAMEAADATPDGAAGTKD
ncbi:MULTISPECIES: amino acid ABC transporter permease [Streptomyces]|uniref:Amino acid ABC transporter permease n=2 Tax=Streptomyces nigrescens TaxID=1920 RepID=A0A640TF60_STRNI|nr:MULTISPECIES: amino acid ABC transporter permease [Streptomyces]MCW7990281.1 amino acid ABC transporter permease [Streptomyces platensis subsp. clarensis]AWN29872.1 amino acid ABC transporter permease [Streptomyces sp. NEAU-S7GS2]MCX5448834.1 amino acid ABC transporter permease [Streptomyces libani]MYT16091.1 ABC transporter permease subunit [Streptomyces sp. SID4951]MYX06708.1 ABC transporter permease subunit [Streptomyces sp. SID8375]